MVAVIPDEYAARVAVALKELAISPSLIAQRALEICHEPVELVTAETDAEGREHLLVPAAAATWRQMAADAGGNGVVLQIASAFRTVDRQTEIIRRKLERGLSLEQILCVSAPPVIANTTLAAPLMFAPQVVLPLSSSLRELRRLDGFPRALSATVSFFPSRPIIVMAIRMSLGTGVFEQPRSSADGPPAPREWECQCRPAAHQNSLWAKE